MDKFLSYILDFLLETLGIIANWGRWSEIVAVKLPDITSGSISHGIILFIRVLEWLIILVGCKFKGTNELEARDSKKSFAYVHYISRG